MKIIIIVLSIIFAYLLLSLATIVKNGVSLTASPGFSKRFKTFMTTHLAETSANHSYTELKSTNYTLNKEALMQEVLTHAQNMNWQIQTKEVDSASFVVETALFKFKDDVTITLRSVDDKHTQLNIRSESRVGTADFGANLGHILQLKKSLTKSLAQ